MGIESLSSAVSDRTHFAVGGVLGVHDDNYEWLPKASIDLILTDPPFNIARDTNFHTYEKNTINSYRFDKDKGWDSHTPEGFRALLGEWARQFHRVLKPGGSFAVFCADEYVSDLITALKAAKLKPRRTLTWRKPNAVPVNRKVMMMSACEYVVLGIKGAKAHFAADIDFVESPELTTQEIVMLADKASVVLEQEIRKALVALPGRPQPGDIAAAIASVVQSQSTNVAQRAINIYANTERSAQLCIPNYVAFNSKAGNRLHPTEKPVPLLQYLMELMSAPGDVVLDPFSGSASLGEAAVLSGREAVLVERDDEFFFKGRQRIEKLASSGRTNHEGLFDDSD